MKNFPKTIALAGVLLTSSGASGHGVTERVAPLEAAAEAAQGAVLADAKASKAAAQVVKLLAKETNDRSLADELKSVAAAARIAESKLASQTALVAAFDAAAPGYRDDLESTRTALELAAGSSSLPSKLRKKYVKAAAKFRKALPPAAPGKVATPVADGYARMAKAAAFGKGFTPYDAGQTHDWVIASVALAGTGKGVDLTGDGEPDNGLLSLQRLAALVGIDVPVDATFNQLLTQGGTFALIEIWFAEGLANDPFVLAGAFSATDGDADMLNDFSGTGTFAPVAETLGTDGHPAARVATSLAKDGAYRIDFSGQAVSLAGLALPEGGRAIVEGFATAATNEGFLGFAIPLTTIGEMLAAQEITIAPQQLALVADVDTDGDSVKDAISASFAFTCVAASRTDR